MAILQEKQKFAKKYAPTMSKNNNKKIMEKADNTAEPIKLETNPRGTKCLQETGIIVLNLNGRIAQTPFVRLCFQKDLKSERA